MKKITFLMVALLFSAFTYAQREVTSVFYAGSIPYSGQAKVTDTLYPDPMITPGCSLLASYRISAGYLCGTNGMKDKEKAERFRGAPVNIKVTKVIALVYSGWGTTAVNVNGYSKVALYSMHPFTFRPQTLLAKSDSVANSTINPYNPYAPSLQFISYDFQSPVFISGGRFFASLMLPNNGGTGSDSLYVLATQQSATCSHDTNAWEKYVDNSWNAIRLSTYGGLNMDVDLAIMPVVVDNTGVEDESWIQTKIFPNPATDEVFVMSSSLIKEISLSNMIGQIVLKVPVNKENTATLRTDNIPKGMYVISVQTAKKIHTQKIEIQ